jgi:hypothetical protein
MHGKFRRLALAALATLACCFTPAFADDLKATAEIKTKSLDASVNIDDTLKPERKLFDSLLAEGRREMAKWRADADKEQREYPENFTGGRIWTFERSYMRDSLTAGRYVSIERVDNTYGGGAHPNISFETILWDKEAGKRISIRTFFKETAPNGPTLNLLAKAARLAVATEKTTRNDNPAKGPPQQLAETDSDIKRGIQPDLLKLGPLSLAASTLPGKSAGLTFYYSPEIVGPHSEGPFIIFVPWTEFKTLLTPEGERVFGGEAPPDPGDKK